MSVRKPISSVGSISKGSYNTLIKEKLVWTNPDRVSGEFLIYGTRVPLTLFLNFLKENKVDEFEEGYPSVSKDKIIGILSHLAMPVVRKSKKRVKV